MTLWRLSGEAGARPLDPVSALPLTACVIVGKLLNLLIPWFFPSVNWGNTKYRIQLWKLIELTYVQDLKWCLVHSKATNIIIVVVTILILAYGANVTIIYT